ncbi:hypothetical protein RIF29_20295 [Crotalaria pallida]|uniref:Uncharacterized protein n=1 Tax=Crotalaria pallida TaxID=3830 RepID=A0AAN9F0V4_CROPI
MVRLVQVPIVLSIGLTPFLQRFAHGPCRLSTIRSSYTWRSLWGYKWIVQQGSRWRIDATVYTLIDADLHTWCSELVSYIFSSIEAKQILSILLRWNETEDKLLWCDASDYPLCEQQPETKEHPFMCYPVSQASWFASPLSIRIDPSLPFWSWIQGLLEVTSFVATHCRAIWKARNAKIVEAKLIFNILGISSTQRWLLPPLTWHTVNTDAACYNDGKTGLGAIV